MPEEPEATPTEPTTETDVDWKAEAEKWKALSRKNETDKKRHAAEIKEFEDWKQSQLSESEKAIESAKAAVHAEYSVKFARTAFLAAAKGRVKDPESVAAGIDFQQFVKDGNPDETKISAFLDGIAPVAPTPVDFFPGIHTPQGDTMALNGDPLLQKVNAALGITPSA